MASMIKTHQQVVANTLRPTQEERVKIVALCAALGLSPVQWLSDTDYDASLKQQNPEGFIGSACYAGEGKRRARLCVVAGVQGRALGFCMQPEVWEGTTFFYPSMQGNRLYMTVSMQKNSSEQVTINELSRKVRPLLTTFEGFYDKQAQWFEEQKAAVLAQRAKAQPVFDELTRLAGNVGTWYRGTSNINQDYRAMQKYVTAVAGDCDMARRASVSVNADGAISVGQGTKPEDSVEFLKAYAEFVRQYNEKKKGGV